MKVPLTWIFLSLVLGQLSIYMRYDLQSYFLTPSSPQLHQHVTSLFLFYQSVQLCNGLLYIIFPYALLTVFVFQFFTLPNRYVVFSYLFILIIFGIQAVYEYPVMDYFLVQKVPSILLQNFTHAKHPSMSSTEQKQIQEFEMTTLHKLNTLFWLHLFEIVAMAVLMYFQYKVEQSNVGFPLLDSVNEQFLTKIAPEKTEDKEMEEKFLDKEENLWRLREREFTEEEEDEDYESEEEEDKKHK